MNDFHNMTSQELFHMVFDNNGQVKTCGRDACIELMYRLKKATGHSYGNIYTGLLELPEAYNVARRCFL